MRGRSQQSWEPVPWWPLPQEMFTTARPISLGRENPSFLTIQCVAVLVCSLVQV